MATLPPASPIEIYFGGSYRTVSSSLTFGRAAELVINEADRFLHRIAGEFVSEGGAWELRNRGSRGPLQLFASDGVHVVLPPGGRTVLTAGTGTISCRGGVQTYEITYRLPNLASVLPAQAPTHGDKTATFGAPLTGRETDFMVAFAAPLLTASGEAMPTYAEVAQQFGVRPKTVDTTLQRLRKKLGDAGVVNVTSTSALVTHLLATGMITYGHLVASLESRQRTGGPSQSGPSSTKPSD